MVLSQEMLKRLMMAKYQLTLARGLLSSGTDFGAWQASISLHDAVETCLVVLCDATNVYKKSGKAKKRTTLYDNAELLDKQTPRHFFDFRTVEDVSEVRNPAKHRGDYPRTEGVSRLLDRTVEMLNENCRIYLDGLTLDAVSIAGLVDESDLKALLTSAEQHIVARRFTDAIADLEHCWLLALGVFRAKFGLGSSVSRRAQAVRIPDELRNAFRELDDTIEKMRSRLELVELGVDLARETTFRSLGMRMSLTESGRRMFTLRGNEYVRHTQEAAQFALAFVLENVIRLQAVERVRRDGDRYEIRLSQPAPYFNVKHLATPVGELPAGHIIDDARFGLGPTDRFHLWFWSDAGETYCVMYETATILRSMTYEEYVRRLRKAEREQHAQNRATRSTGDETGSPE